VIEVADELSLTYDTAGRTRTSTLKAAALGSAPELGPCASSGRA
jgi:hypothetical protein